MERSNTNPHSPNGDFARVHDKWTPDRWEDGYIDNRGRWRVYRPDYPRAYHEGYALRAHIVWWLHYGQPHPNGTNLHYINCNKQDDRLENLTIMNHGEHSTMHNAGNTYVELACDNCGKSFKREIGRINSKERKAYRGKFCSLQCYWKAGGRWREKNRNV